MRPGVRHTADKHSADGEDLLSIGVGTDIAKAHTGQAAEGKIKGSDVGAAHSRASHRAVDVGRLQTFAQLMEPPLKEKPEHETTMSKSYDSCYLCVHVFCQLRARWQWQDSTAISGLSVCSGPCVCVCVCVSDGDFQQCQEACMSVRDRAELDWLLQG